MQDIQHRMKLSVFMINKLIKIFHIYRIEFWGNGSNKNNIRHIQIPLSTVDFVHKLVTRKLSTAPLG